MDIKNLVVEEQNYRHHFVVVLDKVLTDQDVVDIEDVPAVEVAA